MPPAHLLAARAVALQAAGAELIVLCTNTMHLVAEQIEAAVTVPFVHIADATAAAVIDAGLERVALLGTGFTMRSPFLRERLAARGLTSSCRTSRTSRPCTASSTTNSSTASSPRSHEPRTVPSSHVWWPTAPRA